MIHLFHVYNMADIIGLCLAIVLLVRAEASNFEDVLTYARARRDDKVVPWYQRVWDFHQYYKTTKYEDGASWYWQELQDDAKHRKLSDIPDGYDEVDIDFEFRFYGHTIKRIYLSTRGLLSMSPFEDGLSSNHFIAPFYGIFDLSVGYDSAIYFESRPDRFIAEWRNVYLHNHTELGAFNFQTQVYKDGEIVFVYRTIQMPLDFSIDSAEFLFGIVGSINIEIAGQNILVYYDPVQVFPMDITSGTVVVFMPLPTCDMMTDSRSCETSKIGFDCRWCNATNTCSDGLDRFTEQWEISGCLEELSQFRPNWGTRSNQKRQSATPTVNPSHWGTRSNQKRQSATPTVNPSPAQSSSNVGVIVIVVIIVIILAAVGGWLVYAYKNPTSKSGIWLMEHRPSQWKNFFAARRGFSRHAEESATN